MISIRKTYLLGFVIVSLLLLTSAYLQVYEGVIPCPLCSLQRLTFGLFGVLSLIGIFLHTKLWGRISVNLLSFITSITGILLAGRQVWMQHFPTAANNTECGVGLQYLLQALPLNQVMQKVLYEGGVECTKRGWEFLHLNMAEWALVWFMLLLLLTMYLFLKEFKWENR